MGPEHDKHDWAREAGRDMRLANRDKEDKNTEWGFPLAPAIMFVIIRPCNGRPPGKRSFAVDCQCLVTTD